MQDRSTTFIYNQTIKLEYLANSSSANSPYLAKGDLFVINCTDNGGIPKGPWHVFMVYVAPGTGYPMIALNWEIADGSFSGQLIITNSGPQDPMAYYGFIDRTDPSVESYRAIVVVGTIAIGIYATYRIWKGSKKRRY